MITIREESSISIDSNITDNIITKVIKDKNGALSINWPSLMM